MSGKQREQRDRKDAYLGIDLTAGARASGYAVLDTSGALSDVGIVGSDDEIVALADAYGASLVAIDCPLGLPEGLCCLETACSCAPSRTPGIRASELAVRALGYGLYHTTKRSIIRPMVYRGIALRRRLEAEGHRVIEVYPYATKVALFGRKMRKKTTPEGAHWLRARVDAAVPGAEAIDRCLTHDELDAVIAAHTAVLYVRGKARALGDACEGEIVVPERAHV